MSPVVGRPVRMPRAISCCAGVDSEGQTLPYAPVQFEQVQTLGVVVPLRGTGVPKVKSVALAPASVHPSLLRVAPVKFVSAAVAVPSKQLVLGP